MARPRRFNHFLLHGTFILTSAFVTLLIAEVFLRFNYRFGTRYPFPSIEKVESKHDAVYRPSRIFDYEFVPNIRTDFWAINSYGLIGKEHKLQKGKGIFRILLLGDSIATHDCAQEFLEAKEKSIIEVWNAAVGSYDVRRYALYLKYKGLKFNPNMVLIYFCLNDFFLRPCIYYKDASGVVNVRFNLLEVNKFCNPNQFLLRHSHLYRFLILSLDNYLLKRNSRPGVDREFEIAKSYLSQIKKTCESRDIALLAVVFPYLKSQREYSNRDQEAYESMVAALRDFKIDFIDLHNYWPEEMRAGLKTDPKDYTHPSPEGHRIVTDLIYDYLISRNLLKESRGEG